MREELRFVNAFIGFCKPSAGTWPTPFVVSQYDVTGLEKEVLTLVASRPKSPVPELICASTKAQHCVILEAKSGTVNDSQAKALCAITPTQLMDQGLAGDTMQPTAAEVDVVYITNHFNSARLVEDFGRAAIDAPVIEQGSTNFRLYSGQIKHSLMNDAFDAGIVFDEEWWPHHFVRCDSKSDKADLASICMHKLLALLFRYGKANIELVSGASIDFWDVRGKEDKNRFRRRLNTIISEAVTTELAGEIARPGKEPEWVLVRDHITISPQALDKISEMTAAFVRRFQSDDPYRKDQPPLFPYGEDVSGPKTSL